MDKEAYAEIWNEFYDLKADKTIGALNNNNFTGIYVANKREAVAAILSNIPAGATIGFGDSVTLEELKLIPALQKKKLTLLLRERKGITPPIPNDQENMYLALTCDVFLTGANAITEQGEIVFVDGKGTRAGPVIFGPKKVIIVAGINKIVKDVDEARCRVKEIAAPLNAKRHNYDFLPCAQKGKCMDCNHKRRMCCATVVLHKNTHSFPGRITVVLVKDILGF